MNYRAVYKKLNSWAPKFYGEKTVGQVVYLVRKMLRPYGVKVKKILDKTNIAISGVTVGGFYEPAHDSGEPDIEIYLVFNECEKNILLFFDESTTKILIQELFITLSHENRHKYQFKNRGLNCVQKYKCKITDETLKQELEYYGDSDEIDCYALEAVLGEKLNKYYEASIKQNYHNLFAKYDKKIYNRFLKKYYKFNQKIIL